MKKKISKIDNPRKLAEALIFLALFFLVFAYLSHKMGLSNMLNTIMQTSYRLLLDTVFTSWESLCSRGL